MKKILTLASMLCFFSQLQALVIDINVTESAAYVIGGIISKDCPSPISLLIELPVQKSAAPRPVFECGNMIPLFVKTQSGEHSGICKQNTLIINPHDYEAGQFKVHFNILHPDLLNIEVPTIRIFSLKEEALELTLDYAPGQGFYYQ